ncbi:hypothetical protein AAEU32_03660 [Pseudoalteromonas sp. SSDWG2]|uniref:hypothetical protein n=1 Tax=Pseudoalteromonas sp. SSDWG2 TaxID=3139391 RepID=UPI003BAB6B4C
MNKIYIAALLLSANWQLHAAPSIFANGQKWPVDSEAQASGAALMSVDQATLADVVNMCGASIAIKFEEGDCSDAKMTARAKDKIVTLANKVNDQWGGAVKLRITEAWDNNNEHSNYSLHYEGRAIDITTDDMDVIKYARLAGLAAEVGFDFVYLEGNHVHVSVKR